MDKLLPCPFCGKREDASDEMLLGEIPDDGFFLHHDFDAAESPSNVTFYGRTRQDCIDAWNTRPTPTHEVLSLKQLREMDGEPVYLVAKQDSHSFGYGIVDATAKQFDVRGGKILPFYAVEDGAISAYATKPAKEGEG